MRKVLKEGVYTVGSVPADCSIAFYNQGKKVDYKIEVGQKLLVKVIYDTGVPGGYISQIIVKEKLSTTLSGNILKEHKSGIVLV